MPGGRGLNDQGGLRSVPGAGPGACLETRAGGGDGQPVCPQAHKGRRGKEIVEGRGCELPYLPPYSPDFNPIERAFSKIKGFLRRAEARTRESLIEAMGLALCLCGVGSGGPGVLRALRGYGSVGQPL